MGQQINARSLTQRSELLMDTGAFQPWRKESWGLGALTRADYCKHINQLSKLNSIYRVFSYTKLFGTICRKSTMLTVDMGFSLHLLVGCGQDAGAAKLFEPLDRQGQQDRLWPEGCQISWLAASRWRP